MAKTIVGVDIAGTAVRAVEVAGPDTARPTLVRFAEEPLPRGAVRRGTVVDAKAVTAALRAVWSAGKFHTKHVVLGVGDSTVVVREATVTRAPLNRIKESLPFQVQDLLPMPVSEAVLDYYPIEAGSDEAGHEIRGLLVAALAEHVTGNIRAADAAGLLPRRVDLVPFALCRTLTGQKPVGAAPAGNAPKGEVPAGRTPAGGIPSDQAPADGARAHGAPADTSGTDRHRAASAGRAARSRADRKRADRSRADRSRAEQKRAERERSGRKRSTRKERAADVPGDDGHAGHSLADRTGLAERATAGGNRRAVSLTAKAVPPAGRVAILDLGAHTTTVVITDAAVPRFVRAIPAGGDDITEAITARCGLDIDAAETAKRRIGLADGILEDAADRAVAAVVRESAGEVLASLRNTIRYYDNTHGGRVERILLTGGAARLPGLAAALETLVRVPVHHGDAFGAVDLARSVDADRLAEHRENLAVALSLAVGSGR